MCGLNAICGPRAAGLVGPANELIRHRGLPGRSGRFDAPGLSMGHVRLPIQGLDRRFDQPYFLGRWAIAYVGEAFNFRELDPSAESDIPVVAGMWDRYGVGGLRAFDGFWSIAAYDRESEELHVVTDPLGKRPLYVHLPTGSVSSEVKPFYLLDVHRDPLYFSAVRKWGYHVGDRTPLLEVRRVMPGTHLVVAGGRVISSETYWTLGPDPGLDLRKELESAVERRLVSDVPVSVLASGGLDSTIILAIMLRLGARPIVFHVDNDEGEYMDMVDVAGCEVRRLSLGDVDLADALLTNDGPVDLGSLLPQVALGRAVAAAGVSVAVSGDGADELFGGYGRIDRYDSQWSDMFEEIPAYHLPRLDKAMMASTVELRCPFLSWGVVRGALALPYERRRRKLWLKESFADLVPRPIIERDKFPLKIRQVRADQTEWRMRLADLYEREVMDEHKRRADRAARRG